MVTACRGVVKLNFDSGCRQIVTGDFFQLAAGKDLTVFVVGAGFSGIGLAHTFKELGIKYVERMHGFHPPI